ncbi:MAG: hypothetical protein AVDCRST_MAG90-128, partial [uncultured Microvirga sp.]
DISGNRAGQRSGRSRGGVKRRSCGRAADDHHFVLGRGVSEGAAPSLVRRGRKGARHQDQGGYDVRDRRCARAGRLRATDLGPRSAGQLQLRHPGQGRQSREARSG